MSWNDFLLRLRALVHRRRAESELDEELSFHLEMQARKHRAAGLPEAQARRNAGVEFGGIEQVREQCRDVRGLAFLESLARDLRTGARVLRKTPLFTAVAVLSLGIGIGANTAIFSLVDTVLVRMLPVRHPEELRVIRWGARTPLDLSATWATSGDDGQGGWTRNVFSWALFNQIRAHSRNLTGVMGFSPLGPVNVAAEGQALTGGAMVASGNYFQGLGVEPVIGRAFTADDESAGGVPPAVISYRFWDRAFGLNPAAIGKTLYLNGRPCVVIGVTPQEFFGISPGGFMLTPQVDVTLPIRWREQLEGSGHTRLEWFGNDLFWVQMMARLAPAHSEAAARSEWSALIAAGLPENLARQLASEAPRVHFDSGARGLDSLRQAYQRPLLILMAVVALTLLMACANLAGLLLARAAARRREIMVRLAVGATRARLVRQLLVEGALLSALGAAAGMVFAWWGVRALVALVASGNAPISVPVTPDLRVFAFTAAVSLATTFLFALVPALGATRVDVAGGLREEGSALSGARRIGAGRVLVALQVAVALVLVAGATLFTRSLANVRSLPLGFNPHHLVLFDLAPGKSGYDEERGNPLYARVLDRLRQVPGVTAASLSAERLIAGYESNGDIRLVGSARRPGIDSRFNWVGPDFFQTLQIPIVLGRGIEARDMEGPRVAVINQTLARQFAQGSPVGKRFHWGFRRKDWEVEVVGVVKDAKYSRLRGEEPPTLYAPYTQTPWGWPQTMSFEVRVAGDAAPAIAAMRRAVADIDRMLPLTDLKTQDAQIDDSLVQERLFASLVGLFSAIALVLAAVGLYGSVAYDVTQRTRDLGVRMALGAGRLAVIRMLLAQVLATIAVGLAVGLPATWALTRVIESLLFGIRPHDPLTLAAASAAVTAIALAAAFAPARRALRIDPVRALRYE